MDTMQIRYVNLTSEYDYAYGAILDGIIYINKNYNEAKYGKKLFTCSLESLC
jgi:hypothetical protein